MGNLSQFALFRHTLSGQQHPPYDPSIIYDEGFENPRLTGGIEEGYLFGGGTRSKEADHLYLFTNASGHEVAYVTGKAIDLTGVNTIVVDWVNTGSGSADNQSYLVVSTNKDGGHSVFDARILSINIFARKEDSLDVSGLSGSYYIRPHARSADATTCELKVYKILLVAA